jgi:hypothetical protein
LPKATPDTRRGKTARAAAFKGLRIMDPPAGATSVIAIPLYYNRPWQPNIGFPLNPERSVRRNCGMMSRLMALRGSP